MATVNGTEYDHIDIKQGSTTTKHMLKDATARGDIENLKSAINYSPEITWNMGAISSTQGTETDSSTRIRTGYTDCRTVEVQSGYKYIIAAYNGETYIGMWNSTGFEKSATWLTTKSVLPTNTGYKFRLVLAKTNDASIETTDGENLTCYAYTDTTLTIPGAAADAKTVGDADTALNQKIDRLTEYRQIPIDVVNNSIFTEQSGYYAEAITNGVQLNNNNSYKTFYYLTQKNTTIYFDLSEITASFLDLTVMENASGTWTESSAGYLRMSGENPVRYRKSSGNLPTAESPIVLPINSLVCVTVTSGVTGLLIHMNIGEFLNGNINFVLEQSVGESTVRPMSQKAVTDAIKENVRISITKNSNTDFTININGYTIPFKYYDYNGLRMHCWNFAEGITKGETVVVPNGTDIIGVLQESGASDFMGGVHGDETNVFMKMYADGIEVNDSVTCKELDIVMYSHLTQVSTGNNIIDRFVHIKMNGNSIEIENTFKCLIDDFRLTVAYNGGLFAWYASDSDFVWLNDRYFDSSNPVSVPLTPSLKSAIVHLIGGAEFAVENLYGYGTQTYNGGISYFSSESRPRLKMYYANDKSATWNTGHVCYGKCRYTLN